MAQLAWLAYVAGCLKTLPLGQIVMSNHECFGGNFGF
jgi:hypothetical protein